MITEQNTKTIYFFKGLTLPCESSTDVARCAVEIKTRCTRIACLDAAPRNAWKIRRMGQVRAKHGRMAGVVKNDRQRHSIQAHKLKRGDNGIGRRYWVVAIHSDSGNLASAISQSRWRQVVECLVSRPHQTRFDHLGNWSHCGVC